MTQGSRHPTLSWGRGGLSRAGLEVIGNLGVEARSTSGRRHAVAETEMTGETERGPGRADVVARSRLDLVTRYG